MELAANLASLSTRVSRKIAREALEEGGEPIRRRASTLAPHEPGPPDLRENIGISPAKSEDLAAVAIGPTKGFAYGFPQEVGTARHAAQPFMRPAFDSEGPKALGIIGQALWRELAGRGFSRSVSAPTPVSSPSGGGVL